MVAVNKTNDETIEANVLNEILWDSRIFSDKINVDCEGGVIKLTGEVNNLKEKRLAEENAWDVIGVIDVNSELKVVHKATLKDEKLKSKILNKIESDDELDEFKLDVDVDAGKVVLRGNVDLYWKKAWTEEIVENIEGVKFIKNLITIVPTEDVTDEIISQEITDSLRRKLVKIDLAKLDIEVEAGIVRMNGKVANKNIWRIVMNTAKYTNGVVKVEDNLQIES